MDFSKCGRGLKCETMHYDSTDTGSIAEPRMADTGSRENADMKPKSPTLDKPPSKSASTAVITGK